MVKAPLEARREPIGRRLTMTKTLTWLLAGAALTLTAGAALAADPQDDARTAARQAAEDARSAEGRREHHEMRVYRHDGDDITVVRDGGREGGRAESFAEML